MYVPRNNYCMINCSTYVQVPFLQETKVYEFNFQQEIFFYLVGPKNVYRHAALGPGAW